MHKHRGKWSTITAKRTPRFGFVEISQMPTRTKRVFISSPNGDGDDETSV